MFAMSATHTIVAQQSLVGMRACRWAGYGYWYWFSHGAPDGPAKTA
jgi:hypothetical protein